MLQYIPILGDILDKIIPDKAQAAQAKIDLFKAQQDGRLKETEVQLSAIIAEANSTDPYTSRARPTFLYVMYAVISLCFIGGITGIWYAEQVAQAAVNIQELLAAIPESLWWLFGTGYLGYTASRSYDKNMAGKNA